MIWEDALARAKEELGISEYTSNWDEVLETARKIMSKEASKIASEEHKEYLNSEEWKQKREIILKRDNSECVYCKNKINELIESGLDSSIFHKDNFMINIFVNLMKIYESNNIYIPAAEVHQLDYQYKQTPQEEEYCVSLCSCCHKLCHSTSQSNSDYWEKQRWEKMLLHYLIELNKSSKFQKQLNNLNKDYIKSITIKPNELNKEGDDGTQD